jgi:aminoglycoside phosphotransferase (APT) family kinase protein
MSVASVPAPDDLVRTWADAEGNARPPLVVTEPLLAFLDAHGIGAGPAEFAPIGDGHSNVTYAVRRGDTTVVLRRPPRPPLPPSAHDVLREAAVLRALAGRARVPRVLAVGQDLDVLGVPFYVMEHVDGAVPTDALPAPLDTPAERRRVADELVDTLVEIHAVDWAQAGLEGFGRPDGYLARQLRRFLGLWEHNRTRDLPAVERVADWLGRHLPASGPATVVHGDYRLGNTLFGVAAPARLLAVLDWEMSTLGDPLADVGYLCAVWSERDDPVTAFELSSVTRREGFPTREELVARYEERSGRAMTDIRWYQALALWKSVVFMEGNYKRAVSGSSDDAFNRSFGAGVLELAERVEQVTRGG